MSDDGQLDLFDDEPRGGEFSRSDDVDAAVEGGRHVKRTEGATSTLRHGSHRHLALRAYADAFPLELTATEAGRIATPANDRVTGGARRTYDLRKRGLVVRGVRGFTITPRGRTALELLDDGHDVRLTR